MRFLSMLIVLTSLALGHVQAQDGAASAALASAMEAMRDGDWEAAGAHAAPAGRVGRDVIEWHRLRAGLGSLTDYLAFLQRNPDWPGLPLMRRKGEAAIGRDAPPDQVVAFFAQQPPQTGTGALRLARAQNALGDTGDAAAGIVMAWRSFAMSKSEADTYLARYADLLKPHHEARLDMLLWRGRLGEARRMLPLVGKDWQALAQARIALRDDQAGVDALIEAVPKALRDDPGLAFERFQWRIRKGRSADAVSLLLERSTSAQKLGQPQYWANWRRILARQMMRDGDGVTAYRLASRHHLVEGSQFADLEWLSGYLALRYLDDPKAALAHFQSFRVAVETPISLGRAGYWEGRAHEALGQPEAARAAYEFGGEYQTSFYGLLAAEKAGLDMDPALTAAQETYPDWQNADFADSSVLRAALLLLQAAERPLAKRFLVHLAETLDRTELGQLAELALSLGEPHIALMIAKQAARQGHVLPKAYFPLHDLAREDLPVAPELALSIARRESEFNPEVSSGAGARGLMQLMPRTAKAMAGELELDYEGDRLLSDWRYNARLGAAYLAKLQAEFGASYVLIAAAYNAGPSRARSWSDAFGDPRSGQVDVVDWIEHIPFRETRNYVMRVMESLLVYRARLSGKVQPLKLATELSAGD